MTPGGVFRSIESGEIFANRQKSGILQEAESTEPSEASSFQGSGVAVEDTLAGYGAFAVLGEQDAVKKLRAEGLPVSPDGTLNPMGRLSIRRLDEWEKINRKSDFMRDYYAPRDLDRLFSAMQQIKAIFGPEYLLVPEEVKGSSIRGNQDFGKSMDLTTVCPRQDQYLAVVHGVERHVGRILNPTERFLVGQMIAESGGQNACPMCYGNSERNAWDFGIVKSAGILERTAAAYQLAEKENRAVTDAELYNAFGWTQGPKGGWDGGWTFRTNTLGKNGDKPVVEGKPQKFATKAQADALEAKIQKAADKKGLEIEIFNKRRRGKKGQKGHHEVTFEFVGKDAGRGNPSVLHAFAAQNWREIISRGEINARYMRDLARKWDTTSDPFEKKQAEAMRMATQGGIKANTPKGSRS
jgi:hypothetical protein